MIVSSYPDKSWALLAEDDRSESYDVDITAIWQTPEGKFVLGTASGCSCWDGDYDLEEFDTLDTLAASIGPVGDDRRYNPSPATAVDIVAEARKALAS